MTGGQRNTALSRLAGGLAGLAAVILAGMLLAAPPAMGGVEWWGRAGIRLAALLSVGAWALSVVIAGRAALPPRRQVLALLAYVAVVAWSASLSPAPAANRVALLDTLVAASAFVIAGASFRHLVARRALTAGVVLVAAGLGTLGLLEAFGLRWAPAQDVARVSSLYFNSNHYSGYLALLVPLTFALTLGAPRAREPRTRGRLAVRVLLGALTLLLLVNLAMSFSWGLLAAGVSLIGLALAWAWSRWGARAALAGGFVAGLLTVAGVALLVATFPRLGGAEFGDRAGRFIQEWVEPSARVRLGIARSAAQVIRDHPWLGSGPGTFIHAYPLYRPPTMGQGVEETLHKFVNYAHNDYLQVASETGLLGLATFMSFWLLVLALRPARGRWGPDGLEAGLLAGLVALLLHGLTDGNLTVIPANVVLAYAFAGLLHAPKAGP